LRARTLKNSGFVAIAHDAVLINQRDQHPRCVSAGNHDVWPLVAVEIGHGNLTWRLRHLENLLRFKSAIPFSENHTRDRQTTAVADDQVGATVSIKVGRKHVERYGRNRGQRLARAERALTAAQKNQGRSAETFVEVRRRYDQVQLSIFIEIRNGRIERIVDLGDGGGECKAAPLPLPRNT
jgi:hypothetical protein